MTARTAMTAGGKWYEFGVPVAEQLALYETFHRDPRNRRIHALTMPFILGSGFAIAASIAFPIGLVVFHLAAICFLTLDLLGALLLAAWVLPLVIGAGHMAQRFGPLPVITGGLAIQIACWYLSVGIGHERYEPRLAMGGRRVSSNVYLERHMFRLQNVGLCPNPVAALLQFLIAPFHWTMQGLFRLGYRPALQLEVDRLVARNLDRLSREEPILAQGAVRASRPAPSPRGYA